MGMTRGKGGKGSETMSEGDQRDVNIDFLFLKTLGEGSFGVVYKIYNRKSGCCYACKEIDYSQMQEQEKMLLINEVNTLREICHPNIIQYVDKYIDKNKQKIYILMELCEGGDFDEQIKAHKSAKRFIPEDQIWYVLISILNALKYCHCEAYHTALRQKIIHRDIKPGNMFLTMENKVLLGDFGLCNSDTSDRLKVGTPLYMPPELLDKQNYTEKVDIWSLGASIYEMAALYPPFAANSIEVLRAKVKQNFRPALPKMYSKDLRVVIDRMMEGDYAKRADVTELLGMQEIRTRIGLVAQVERL